MSIFNLHIKAGKRMLKKNEIADMKLLILRLP